MRVILTVLLLALPFGYLGLMKAIGQAVEWWVIAAMLPFMALPLLLGAPLSRLSAKDEDRLARGALGYTLASLGGMIVVPRPSSRQSLRDKAISSGIGIAAGSALVLWGGRWRLDQVPLPYVGYFIIALSGLALVWAILGHSASATSTPAPPSTRARVLPSQPRSRPTAAGRRTRS